MITDTYSNSIDATARNLAAQQAANDMPTGVSPAYRVGFDDARNGAAFAPECYFASDSRRMSYTLGFLSVRPDCTPALAMYMELVPDQGDDVEYAERSI